MRIITLTLTLLFLNGCASFQNSYNELGLNNSELALVTGSYKPGLFYTDYAVYIDRVYDESGNQVLGNPDPKSWNHARLDEVRLQPGKYVFHAMCDSGYTYSFPKIALLVKSNKTYLLACEKTMKKDALGLEVIDKIHLSVKEVDSHKTSSKRDAVTGAPS